MAKCRCIKWKYYFVLVLYQSTKFNAYTKFYQNSFICSEDIEEKHIFTSIKGHNSVVYKSQTTPSWYQCPCKSLKKIGQKLLKLESGNDIFTSIKGHNSDFKNKFSPFAIPNHSSPISMSMQSLKKIGQKLLKLRVRKWSADRWTDRHSKNFRRV